MPQSFTPWENATDVPASSRPGMLKREALTPLTLLTALIITAILWPNYGVGAVFIGAIFGRLLALDLTTYTLPNVYTVPLMAVGFVHATVYGGIFTTLLIWLMIFLLAEVIRRGGTRLGYNLGMGGGDLKLLAAMFAFLAPTEAFFAITLGCLLWLPVTFKNPKLNIPFGVPLILGWTLLLMVPHLPNWLMSAIS